MTFSIAEAAARLLRDDPLFTVADEADQEEAASLVIEAMGRKADTVTISMVVNAAMGSPIDVPAAPRTPVVMSKGYESMLARVQIATGLSDPYLARILGVSRPTVQLWRSGRGAERLTRAMRDALRVVIEGQIEASKNVLTELERQV